MPRSRSVSANASCSWRARLTQRTSSKRSSWQFDGREPPELEVGAVEEDAAQRADLGIDVERGHVMIVLVQRRRA